MEFQKAQNLLQSISTEQLEMDAECFSGKVIGFDPTISRLLLSGAPPRQVKIPTTEEALSTQQKFLGEMLHICDPGEWASMEELRIFLANFSRERPTIVPRSYAVVGGVIFVGYEDNECTNWLELAAFPVRRQENLRQV